MNAAAASLPGALVISLDFELHWGVRDHLAADGPYRPNLIGARAAIPRLLVLFREFEIAATWATVGLLFAGTREEQLAFRPAVLPGYHDPRLSPYHEPVGEGEASDPLHFAAGLIRQVAATPGQEIGSHTYSHYFCLEPGSEIAAFEADLVSAVAAARQLGVRLESLVFPRNQSGPAYEEVLTRHGIAAFRGRQSGWMHQGVDAGSNTLVHRAARFADLHAPLSGDLVVSWAGLAQPSGLYNVAASSFLRPVRAVPGWLERRRLARLTAGLRQAATRQGLFHLWWHPHNFGRYPDQNLAFLRELLETFAALREREGMRSLAMRDVVACARGAGL